MLLQGIAGPQTFADGAYGEIRLGRLGDAIISELHGRFYEQAYRGNLFSGGMGLTSISNATFTTGTLSASCTPVVGVWNPVGSGVNLVILQAVLGIAITAATNTGGHPFVWATSVGNGVITTGAAPLSRATLQAAGSKAKDMSGAALTGLTTNMVVRQASALGGGSSANFSFVGTAVGQATTPGGFQVENLDGSLIVPPGGVLALLATTTPVAHSAASGIVWEEVQIN